MSKLILFLVVQTVHPFGEIVFIFYDWISDSVTNFQAAGNKEILAR